MIPAKIDERLHAGTDEASPLPYQAGFCCDLRSEGDAGKFRKLLQHPLVKEASAAALPQEL